MKSIFRTLETSGFTFKEPRKEIANRQNSSVLIYFIIQRLGDVSHLGKAAGSKYRSSETERGGWGGGRLFTVPQID